MELVRNLLTRRAESNLELSSQEALEQVVAFLEHQRVNYERLPVAERKGHVWEAVRVLRRELIPRVENRKIEGQTQGY